MRLTIERAALLKALNHVQSVVERRNTIPILSNVLITASAAAVSFAATDLDIEIVETSPADVEVSGAITAPAHTLYEIVRKLPDGAQVRFDLAGDDPRLTVSAGRSRFQLPVLPASDFPAMSAGSYDVRFSLAPAALIKLIDRTRFAISTEETRYYLNGVYLHAPAGENVLRGVATDGHRLALAEQPLPEGAAAMPGVIIPRKAIQEIRRLVDDAKDEVEIALSDAKIRVSFGQAHLTSKLIDGSFPDYSRVIPRGNPKTLTVGNKLFADAVDRVATISAERSRSVKLSLDQGRIVLTVSNPESGAAVEEIAADYDHEPMEIGFNARYLLDIAGQIGEADAVFELNDSASPTLVRNGGESESLFVLMPLRV
jgi:DNA polymerase III subunit beta